MNTEIVDKNYNYKFISDSSDMFKDEFDRLLDSIFGLYKSSRISKDEMKLLIKLAFFCHLKSEVKEEKKNIKNFFNMRTEKRIDTLSINFTHKEYKI